MGSGNLMNGLALAGVIDGGTHLLTSGVFRQYKAQKEAMKAQQQAQLQANFIQQQALQQQKAAAEEQRKLQERELANQEQTNEMKSKYNISNNRNNNIDKNSADLTKGLGGGALPLSKKALGSEDEDFNQWY